MVLSRLTKITGPGIATDTNWVGNNADFAGITTTSTSFNIGVTTIHSTLIESHNIVSTGVVTAVSFVGDGTGLTGVANTDFVVGTAITMTTANFTGNVTIGGTLTYEDVTNVDSVGIVTAAAVDVDDFLDVGSNIKLGNAGVITATSFVGSGAALTGIDATAIKDSGGNVKIQAQASGAMYTGIHTFSSGAEVGSNIKLGNAGVITATSFVGSGADLTGVTQSDTPLASSSASTIFYESDDEITVSDNTTLSRSSSNSGVIYTKYQQVVVANTKSLIVADGETFVVDAYGLRTPDL